MKKDKQKTALVLGAGGFIGNALVSRLKSEGWWVRGADLKLPEFNISEADEFLRVDLRNHNEVSVAMLAPDQYALDDLSGSFDRVYQLAADMGGAGYIFTGEHDSDVMHNSAQINLNVADLAVKFNVKLLFYSSSACIYPEFNQVDPDNPLCSEESAYPAKPDSEYGWEKLFSERLYKAYDRNHNLNVRIARFHNIYGLRGSYNNGKEKAPAAICRKVIQSGTVNDYKVDVWGDGNQTRSFLFIYDCLDGIEALMKSNYTHPVNIGSEEMVTINQLVECARKVEDKRIAVKHIDGPQGVRGRNSDNTLIYNETGWKPKYSLEQGIELTYKWIKGQLTLQKK